jgi:hypothetical protein
MAPERRAFVERVIVPALVERFLSDLRKGHAEDTPPVNRAEPTEATTCG